MSFITIDKLNGSSGETISTITVPEYQGLEDRTQSFKVVVDGKEVFVNVQQKAFKPSLTTNKQVVPFTQEVLTQSLQITSNFNWEARTDSSWFTLSQTEGNKGTTTIEISTSSIDSPSENRNGTINFYFGDAFVTAITVKQEFEVIFEVSTTSIDMTEELTTSIDITSNVDWTCEVDGTWISVDIVSGFGNKTITVTAQTFKGQNRNAYIKFYIGGEFIKNVKIYQISGTVEIPTDIEDCFYIEPIEGTLSIGNCSSNSYNIVRYFKNGIWNDLDVNDEPITIRNRMYFSKGGRFGNVRFECNNKFNIGGRLSTIVDNPNYLFSNTKVVDASNLLLDIELYTSTGGAPVPSYKSMFEGCGELLYPPKEVNYVYNVANSCENMFAYCRKMKYTPYINCELNSFDYKGNYNFKKMFAYCSKIKEAYINVSAINLGMCYRMFEGCYELEKVMLLTTEINYGTIYSDGITDTFAYWLEPREDNGFIYKRPNVDLLYDVVPYGWQVIETTEEPNIPDWDYSTETPD